MTHKIKNVSLIAAKADSLRARWTGTPGLYEVESGENIYIVNVVSGQCTCPRGLAINEADNGGVCACSHSLAALGQYYATMGILTTPVAPDEAEGLEFCDRSLEADGVVLVLSKL